MALPVKETAVAYIAGFTQSEQCVVLDQPTVHSFVSWDGSTNRYLSGGNDQQIIMPHITKITATDQAPGGLAYLLGATQTGAWRYFTFEPTDTDPRYLAIIGGLLTTTKNLAKEIPSGLGIVVRDNAANPAKMLQGDGIPILVNNVPNLLLKGTAGTIVGVAEDGNLAFLDGASIGGGAPGGGATSGSGADLSAVVAKNTSANVISLAASAITCTNSSGDATTISNFSGSVDLSSNNLAGGGGTDGTAEAASTWYYIYIVTDDAGSATAAVASTQSTGPQMANAWNTLSFTRWALASMAYNDASSNLISFIQRGRRFVTSPQVVNTNASASTAYGSITLNTATCSLPPNVAAVSGNIGGNGGSSGAKESASRIPNIASTTGGVGEQALSVWTFGSNIQFSKWRYWMGEFNDVIIDNAGSPAFALKIHNASSTAVRIEITGYLLK